MQFSFEVKFFNYGCAVNIKKYSMDMSTHDGHQMSFWGYISALIKSKLFSNSKKLSDANWTKVVENNNNNNIPM